MNLDMDSQKLFSSLSLLAPLKNSTDEYNSFINSSKNNEVEIMLDQPSKKRSGVKNEIFFKRRRDNFIISLHSS